MTLEAQIAEVQRCGWRVHNLFQLDDGRWQCNLRKEPETRFEFAHGATASEALASAITRAGLEPVVTVEDLLG